MDERDQQLQRLIDDINATRLDYARLFAEWEGRIVVYEARIAALEALQAAIEVRCTQMAKDAADALHRTVTAT